MDNRGAQVDAGNRRGHAALAHDHEEQRACIGRHEFCAESCDERDVVFCEHEVCNVCVVVRAAERGAERGEELGLVPEEKDDGKVAVLCRSIGHHLVEQAERSAELERRDGRLERGHSVVQIAEVLRTRGWWCCTTGSPSEVCKVRERCDLDEINETRAAVTGEVLEAVCLGEDKGEERSEWD